MKKLFTLIAIIMLIASRPFSSIQAMEIPNDQSGIINTTSSDEQNHTAETEKAPANQSEYSNPEDDPVWYVLLFYLMGFAVRGE